MFKQLDEGESIHLTNMPEIMTYDGVEEINSLFNLFFELKEKVNKELENARDNKVIGSSLEALVEINLDDKYKIIKENITNIQQLFIVSKVIFVETGNEITVKKSNGEKCNRCWNYVSNLEDDICERCNKVLKEKM